MFIAKLMLTKIFQWCIKTADFHKMFDKFEKATCYNN